MQQTLPKRIRKKQVSLIAIFILLFSISTFTQNNNNRIWGNSAGTSIGEPLYNPRTWGMAPSQQTLNTIPNRNSMGGSNNSQTVRYRNSAGNLLQVDEHGNIVYDPQGNPTIDSAGSGYAYTSGTMNADADGSPPPPPDDPVDAPIDSGIVILLMIGVRAGYENKNKVQLKSSKIFL